MPSSKSSAQPQGRSLSALKSAPFWIFDLDNTLYPASANLFDEIDRRMCSFIADYLKIGHAEAYKVQKSYFRAHGTTLKGLMDLHGMDPGPYLEYVHDVDMSCLACDPRLDEALARLPGRKFIFTNATTSYATRVLDCLNLSHHFEAIYADLIGRYGVRPEETVMVEDVARNLIPAKALGMTTIWVETDRPWAKAEAVAVTPDFVTTDLAGFLTDVTRAAA